MCKPAGTFLTASTRTFQWSTLPTDGCAHVYAHVYPHVYTLVHTQACSGMPMYACLYICLYTCLQACLYTYLYACLYARPYTCLYACLCTGVFWVDLFLNFNTGYDEGPLHVVYSRTLIAKDYLKQWYVPWACVYPCMDRWLRNEIRHTATHV